MTGLMHLISSLLPGACLLCDAVLEPAESVPLCPHCRAALPWNEPSCSRCAEPMVSMPGAAPHLCGRCRQRPPPFTRTLAPLRFEGFAADWVRRLKDHQGLVEGRLLGELLAEHAAAHYDTSASPPELLVPVPLSWGRLARRGHNQALAIATPVARRLGIPVARRAVLRLGGGRAQRRLTRRQRLANPAVQFSSRRDWTGTRCIALVDDVMTTGTTAAALARTLLAAGAAEVHVLCAARTPP